MLRIRLTRMGAKKKPFYRVILKEKRSKRDGRYLENLGTYDPKVDPPEVKLNHERIEYWLSKGAQPTETVASLIKNNPQLTAEELAEVDRKRAEVIAAKKEAMVKAKVKTEVGQTTAKPESAEAKTGEARVKAIEEKGATVAEKAEAAEKKGDLEKPDVKEEAKSDEPEKANGKSKEKS